MRRLGEALYLPSNISPMVRKFGERLALVRSPNTAESYVRGARELERFLESANIDLRSTHRGLLDDFVEWMARRDLTPATIGLMCVGARRYIDWRRKNGEEIPLIDGPDLPKVHGKGIVTLNDDQLARFFGGACAWNDPTATMMLLLPMTGMRGLEVVQLRVSDLIKHESICALKVLGKGKKYRWVPLGPQARAIMARFYKKRIELRSDTDLMFPGKKGMTRPDLLNRARAVRKAVMRIGLQIGFPGLHPHMLRKTYITYLDARGVSPLMIAQLVGHGSVGQGLDESMRVTVKHYVGHQLDALAAAIEKITFPAPVKMENSS